MKNRTGHWKTSWLSDWSSLCGDVIVAGHCHRARLEAERWRTSWSRHAAVGMHRYPLTNRYHQVWILLMIFLASLAISLSHMHYFYTSLYSAWPTGFFHHFLKIFLVILVGYHKKKLGPRCHWKKMLIKVKTLTGKEIEIDIEPTDRVERIKVISNNSQDIQEVPQIFPPLPCSPKLNGVYFRRGLKRRRESHHSSRGWSFLGNRWHFLYLWWMMTFSPLCCFPVLGKGANRGAE